MGWFSNCFLVALDEVVDSGETLSQQEAAKRLFDKGLRKEGRFCQDLDVVVFSDCLRIVEDMKRGGVYGWWFGASDDSE